MADMTMGREARAIRGAAQEVAGNAMKAATRMGGSTDSVMNAGMAWWDMMLRMQRASLASLSVYSPTEDLRISGSVPQRRQAGTQVIPVGEERLNIATRTEYGETTRIRRRVVSQPVEQEVTLRDERVVVERRPAGPAQQGAAAAPRGEVLTETVVEMTDSRQVPQVWKSVHVAEEVVLRREVTERKERVRETVRRDVVEVEHDREARGAMQVEAEEVERIPAHRVASEIEAARQRTEALAEAAREATVPAPSGEAARPQAGEAARPQAIEARRAEEASQQDRRPQPGTPPGPPRKA